MLVKDLKKEELIKKKNKMCTRCVMDTTDPGIEFGADGICIHCKKHDEWVEKYVITGDEGRRRLEEIVDNIKREGINRDYDCLIGVSGGVDSSYVAYKVKELGLRPLAVHLDNGWNSELAVDNIYKMLKKLDIDLHTHVINWEEFKDLQLSFLKASTPDSEIPTDHAIFSLMYNTAVKENIKYIITGRNVRTETHLPRAWSQGHMDWRYIKSVQKQYGNAKLKTFPRMDFHVVFKSTRILKWVDILDYIDYKKKDAIKVLEDEFEWRGYGGKHYESLYTKFYQGYILPKKFGYDKRRSHFSSLICSGEMTRIEALTALKMEIYPIEEQQQDRVYVIKKLGLTDEDFENIMSLPHKTIYDYPSYARLFTGRIFGRLYGVYCRLANMYYHGFYN
ncbi:MAG: N-acetyl sugar amidotransferase [Candidatus Scalindua sp.]